MHRRTLLGALGAVPALACAGLARAQDFEPGSWLGYDARLRRLLADPPGAGFQPGVEGALVGETNRFRAQHGAAPLTPHAGLNRVARAAAADMASRNFFDHLSPEGHAPSVRVGLLARELCGLSGENIAYQEGGEAAPTARDFFVMWRDSPGHRENMLRPLYTHVGHGAVRVGERTYAAQAFALESIRLGAEPPLRLTDDAAFGEAVAEAAPRFDRFQLSAPDGGETSPVLRLGQPLPGGAWRLRPHLPDGPNRYKVLWGPIFVAG